MSISSALNNAMSGLRAAGRRSEVIAANIANAATPGYGRRTLSVSSNGPNPIGGVRINGVQRHVDQQILADRRIASASYGFRTETTRYLTRVEDLLGTPDQPGSLSARLSDFENSLITASSRPDAPERLEAAALAARDLATTINSVSDGIQDARTQADRSIAAQVDRLNDALGSVRDINQRIVRSGANVNDTSALEDERQRLIDEISEIVPVRTVERQYGALALYTTGGAILLDGTAATLEFDPVNVVTPYMSVEDGTLSGLTINGFSGSPAATAEKLRGGTLAAQLEIRDTLGPDAQKQIDAIARDLIERFQDPAVDPTLGAGQPGLFTDQGAALDPLAELGLADRLSVNALVDPTRGGEPWRIRDGLGAIAPGDAGNAQLINALADTLASKRAPASGAFTGGIYSAVELTASFSSQIGTDRLRDDKLLTFAASQFNELRQMELADGVDTDAELQRLILVEQAYAANARIIEVVDEMMNDILRI